MRHRIIGLVAHRPGTSDLAAQDVGTAKAQAPPQSQTQAVPPEVSEDTLVVGTTILRLGMPKDDAVRMLSARYNIEFRDKLGPSETIDVRVGKQDLVATVHFDAKGTLERADKFWTPDMSKHYSDGEIGRAIFALWGTLPTGVGCRLIALQSHDYEGPPYTQSQIAHVIRDAHIECGHKRITFTTLTSKSDESLNITEEIDSKSILQRP